MARLEGRVALVTGSAHGIGAACAVELASRGAKVAVADINEEGAERTVATIADAGGDAMVVRLNVAEEGDWHDALATVVGTWGPVQVLHNNAGAVGADTHSRDNQITLGEVEAWDRIAAVNLRGVMLGCKHCIPAMIDAGGGVIINTSSTSVFWGGARAVAYGASKSGVLHVTQHVASRYGRHRIRCVAVAPGFIATDSTHAPKWMVDAMLREQCLPQVGQPEDIAKVVGFLASDDASFVTGVLIPVDAGQTCHRPWLSDELEHEDAAASRT